MSVPRLTLFNICTRTAVCIYISQTHTHKYIYIYIYILHTQTDVTSDKRMIERKEL